MPDFRYFSEECPSNGQLIEYSTYPVDPAADSDSPGEVYRPALGVYLSGGCVVTAYLSLVELPSMGCCWRPVVGADVLPAVLKSFPPRG